MKECKSAVQNCTEIEIVLKKCWTIWVSPSQIGFCNCKNIKMYANFGKSGCSIVCLIYVLLQWSMVGES